ncbi:hypothetical protein Ddye_028439 [Dipteronia dyeriana]|uniref:Gnk2-homologous domain-containing protein n=1 Tax=Dipteronia dyeriana TaxID=168575 RepID=A0AAD9TQY5_9ROSI|nr:hypothetical protein Ddye_028439 [Dipteronia dyeriana]
MSINTDAVWLCSYPGNFTTNSTFGRNRDLILSTLASQVSVNGGFYNATVGQDPDKVYALHFAEEILLLKDASAASILWSRK